MENLNTQPGHAVTPTATDVRTHTVVWALLLLLTAVTVGAAGLLRGAAAAMVCLAVSALQAVLVLLYFMHLRHEKRVLLRLVIPITVATLAIFIGLTFVDVITR